MFDAVVELFSYLFFFPCGPAHMRCGMILSQAGVEVSGSYLATFVVMSKVALGTAAAFGSWSDALGSS